MALTAEQIDVAMAAASADLKFLMDREGVSMNIQASLYHAGVVKTRQFAAFDADALELAEDGASAAIAPVSYLFLLMSFSNLQFLNNRSPAPLWAAR